MGAGDGVMGTMAGYKDIKMTPVPAEVAKQIKVQRPPPSVLQ